jgi:cytochrome c-type biogenesis protein CcmH/NrfF
MWVVPVLAVIALVALAVVVAQRAAAPAQAVVGATPQTPANDYETQLEQQVKDAS